MRCGGGRRVVIKGRRNGLKLSSVDQWDDITRTLSSWRGNMMSAELFCRCYEGN